MASDRMVLIVHSARRAGRSAAMEAACDELRRRGFEVLEVQGRDEDDVLESMRETVRLFQRPPPAPSATTTADDFHGNGPAPFKPAPGRPLKPISLVGARHRGVNAEVDGAAVAPTDEGAREVCACGHALDRHRDPLAVVKGPMAALAHRCFAKGCGCDWFRRRAPRGGKGGERTP